jgi:hypothetical protein
MTRLGWLASSRRLLGGLLLVAVLLLAPAQAFAATLSQVSPDPASSSPSGAHVFLIRSNSNLGYNPEVQLKAYYPLNTNWSAQYIQINPYLNGPCQTYAGTMTAFQQANYITVTITSGPNGSTKTFPISRQNACKNTAGRINTQGSGSNELYAQYDVPNQPLPDPDTAGQFEVVTIDIQYNANISRPDTSVGNNNATFSVVAKNGSGQNTNVQVGPLGGNDNNSETSQYNFPIIGKDSVSGGTKINIPFGLKCNQTTDMGGVVGIYDSDNGVFPQTLVFQVVDVTLKAFHRYELKVFGLNAGNTVVVNLPGDTIYGSVKCPNAPNAHLTPHAQLTANGRTYTQGANPTVPAGQSVIFHNWVSTSNTSNTSSTRFQYNMTDGASTTPHPGYVPGLAAGSFPYEPDGNKPTNTSLNDYSFTIPAGTPSGTVFCRKTIIDTSTLESFVTYGSPPTAEVCFHVGVVTPPGAVPYFSVLGGDTAAGPGFGSSCDTTSTDASIIANFNASVLKYGGASSQLAALALTDINGFATGKYNDGSFPFPWRDSVTGNSINPLALPNNEQELAFANTGPGVTVNNSAGDFGGSFGDQNWCVDDYYSEASDAAVKAGSSPVGSSTVNLSSLKNGYNTYNGNLQLNGDSTTLVPGKHITLIVKGDVYITGAGGGIRYNNLAGVSSTANIPSFQLIVTGRILIDRDVAELDGFYDAQGSPTDVPAAGQFITCADASGGIADYTKCNTQLTVKGAVAATQVILNRTSGDVNGTLGPQAPAETFLFSPQLWLPSADGGGALGPWDSVTSLPPIL